MIGQYVQNYRITAHLGEGGMGVVFKAIDNVLGREVALKMLHSAMTRQPQVLERFKKEAQVLARLLHPNIAVIYNFIEQDGQYYMVMEYVEGKNLDALARSYAALPPAMTAAMFIQALEGLQHAHKKNIFHRDIKPSNLILTPEGTVKLMDFGIAKIAGEQRLTQVNRVIGTVEFMAPELIEGKDPSVASDIYAAGITMYELLSGRLPFENHSDFTLMQDILKKKPVPLTTINPSVPAALSKAVMKALEKKPENRFADAKSFQQALMAATPDYRGIDLGMPGAAAYPASAATTALTRVSDTSGGSISTRQTAPATIIQQLDQKILRNRKLPYILAGAGLLALLAIVFFTSPVKNRQQQLPQQAGGAPKDSAAGIVSPLYANTQTGGTLTPPAPATTQKAVEDMPLLPVEPLAKTATPPAAKKEKLKKDSEKKELPVKETVPVVREEEPVPAPPVTEKPAEKTTVRIDGKVEVALRMRETISSNEDGREQPVTFTVSRPVIVRGITIIREGAVARGRVKIGRVLSTVDIIAVMAANGQEMALRERDHRKVKNLASDRNYTAVLIKGSSLNF